MPCHLLHPRDSIDEVVEPEGIEMSADVVAGTALMTAHDCMAGDVKNGPLDLRYRIDVEDDSGAIVHILAFRTLLKSSNPHDDRMSASFHRLQTFRQITIGPSQFDGIGKRGRVQR